MDVLTASDLPTLLDVLQRRGYTTVGPTVRDGALTLDRIGSVEDLPAGWTAEPAPGRYRLVRRGDGAYFASPVGPDSLKRFLFPPEETLLAVHRNGNGTTFAAAGEPQRYAFLGVRACDLAAVAVLDEVLLGGGETASGRQRPAQDPRYRARREAAFLVAVECAEPAETCFCTSLGTGPAVTAGSDEPLFATAAPATRATSHRQAVPDLVLRELVGEGGHRFLLEARTDAGREVAAELPLTGAPPADVEAARQRIEEAARRMDPDLHPGARAVDAADASVLLRDHPDHPRWDEVARRCLTCGNCTLVCPTCFCHTVAERPALEPGEDGLVAERVRRWDSCFNIDHSYLHGGSVRTSPRSRYRQWLTHKLSSWVDQFGTPGCVGCGRCIAWCPVGIDLTEEVAALGAGSGAAPRPGG